MIPEYIDLPRHEGGIERVALKAPRKLRVVALTNFFVQARGEGQNVEDEYALMCLGFATLALCWDAGFPIPGMPSRPPGDLVEVAELTVDALSKDFDILNSDLQSELMALFLAVLRMANDAVQADEVAAAEVDQVFPEQAEGSADGF